MLGSGHLLPSSRQVFAGYHLLARQRPRSGAVPLGVLHRRFCRGAIPAFALHPDPIPRRQQLSILLADLNELLSQQGPRQRHQMRAQRLREPLPSADQLRLQVGRSAHDLADPWRRFKSSQSYLRFESNPPVLKAGSAYIRENADELSMLRSSRCFDRRISFHEVS